MAILVGLGVCSARRKGEVKNRMTDPGRLTVHDVVDSPWNCNLALRAMGHSNEVGGEVVKPKVIDTKNAFYDGNFARNLRVSR
jgi:hypothetical protein